MKRFFHIISLTFIIGLITFSIAPGQEKKSEQRIKVIVADGSDSKIVIDTVFNDDLIRDSIMVKNGKVIFIGNHGEKKVDFTSKDNTEHIFVTVTSDEKDTKNMIKELTIVNADTVTRKANEKTRKIFVYNDDERSNNKSGEHQKVIKWSEKDDDGSDGDVFIINDAKVNKKDIGESYTYTIKKDVSGSRESDSESTKYVITKDGMVITIEGGDYEKVKSLAKEIEGKMNAKNNIKGKKSDKK